MKVNRSMIVTGVLGLSLLGMVGCGPNPALTTPDTSTANNTNTTQNSTNSSQNNGTSSDTQTNASNQNTTTKSTSGTQGSGSSSTQNNTNGTTDGGPNQQGTSFSARSTYTVDTNGHSYQISPGKVTYDPTAQLIHVTVTNKGVVWNPVPQMSEPISNEQSLNNHPVGPYSLYLNTANDETLSTENSEEILTLPLTESTSGGSAYVYLSNVVGAGDWVIYGVDLRAVGMPQPTSSELFALNLSNNESTKITDYEASGGNQFSIAISGTSVYYKQVNAGAATNLYKYNLSSGTSEHLTWAPSGLNWINF